MKKNRVTLNLSYIEPHCEVICIDEQGIICATGDGSTDLSIDSLEESDL